jgi:succinoglycan biosynthesis protein ExoM
MSHKQIIQILQRDHISVCICTYKRSELLACLLDKVISQFTDNRFSFEIIVVDNDYRRSAEAEVKRFQRNEGPKIIYDCEPEQNISLARNRAILNSIGTLIAFIDDDEYPENNWLLTLLSAYKKFSVDGVLGPVLPLYQGIPPEWLVKSGLCNRKSFKTGTILTHTKHMRTGNVLFKKQIVECLEKPFEPKYGRTGSEDTHFFNNMIIAGHTFVWCNEAYVYENVPRERQKFKYFVKRALINGVATADQQKIFSFRTIKSLAAVALYTLSLPVLMAVGYHLFVKFFIKDCDHTAKLFAHCGVKLIRERNF